jgi:hypothetical protein
MHFNLFHLMPYPYLPADFDEKHSTASLTIPNGLFDPAKGQELYNRYLDELEFAEKLGFDAICVNEHHQSAYGIMPSPNIIAAALARANEPDKALCIGQCHRAPRPSTPCCRGDRDDRQHFGWAGDFRNGARYRL